MPASAGFERSGAQDLYRALSESFAALPGVERASISALVPFGNNTIHRTVQRAGAHPAPDANRPRPLKASLHAALEQRGRGLFCGGGTCPFARTRFHRRGGDAARRAAGRDHRRDSREKTLAGRKRSRPAYPIPEEPKMRSAETCERQGEIKRGEAIEIIGIVPATTARLFESQPPGAIYLPFARGFASMTSSSLCSSRRSRRGSEAATADLLRRTVHGVDPVLPVLGLQTFAQHLESNAAALDRPRGRGLVFDLRRDSPLGLPLSGSTALSLFGRAPHP